ncbi:type 2 lanthipeptide synthetase LanM family protein [Paenibacillus amylolyticus]|uniref:type 2 lanthipeptide synthetase LanM family protein n=1 Tax=Paenibacillus amylolyticus TaxID=1451 RepID=UPI00249BA67E|nr:type 2 lanthipeptide synthetase LanM family protein [Paenibacillus amylolyticus]WFA87739.1 type 2 lanthipeptide synthetase LanM family protein [Paenibacillus amylolyticus]
MADSREIKSEFLENKYSKMDECHLHQEDAWRASFNEIMGVTLPQLNPLSAKKLFFSFCEPFIVYSQFKLTKMLNSIGSSMHLDEKSLSINWEAELYTKLFNLSVRTLIQELHIARISGVLVGVNSNERYHYYNNVMLKDKEYIDSFFSMYPVLAKLMVEATEKFIQFNEEILINLDRDIDQVRLSFQADYKKLEIINTGVGDTHHKGRSVSILTFSEGEKLIYKPRPMKIDCAFEKIIEWINEKTDKVNYITVLTIDKVNYGWQFFIERKDCSSKEEVQRYYYRYGGLVALLYVLNSRDFHFENIIAHGEHPILIDLETLFSNSVELELENESIHLFRHEMDHSVFSSLLIPSKISPEDNIDKSGLGQWGNKENEIISQVIDAPFTDTMKLIQKKVFSKGSSNKPQLNNQPENYLHYIDQIEAGFSEVYLLMMSHCKELISSAGPIQVFRDVQVRHIFRPTSDYAEFLKSGLHPDYLQNMLSRMRLFKHLQQSSVIAPYFEAVVPYEIESLLNQEIPVFTFQFDGEHISYADEKSLDLTFRTSSFHRVIEQLKKLSYADYEKQRRYLRMSLASSLSYEGIKLPPEIPTSVKWDYLSNNIDDDTKFLQTAMCIGDELMLTGVWDQKFKTVIWIDRKSSGNKNNYIGMLEPTLYEGSLGIILFLAYLAQESGEQKYRDFAERALKSSLSSMTETHKNRLSSFNGLISMAYTLLHLATLWHDKKMFEEAITYMKQIGPLIKKDKELDIIGGSAGAIIVLMNVYSQTQDPVIKELACKCGEHLLMKLKERLTRGEELLLGLSHGVSGYAWAFTELWAATKNEKYLNFANLLIEMERDNYNEVHNNWRDKRLVEDRAFQSVFWCHGAPGIALSRAKMLMKVNDEKMIDEIKSAISKIRSDGLHYEPFLCHGSLGNIDVLLSIMQMKKSLEVEGIDLKYLASQIIHDHRKVSSIDYPLGMMTGISGYGYSLLRLNNSKLPSILAFEISPLKL